GDGLERRAGQSRRRAEELCRSARSKMEGQDRQGSSRLQRRDPDRDLPDFARPRLVLFRKARAAERNAVAIGGRAATQDCTWRARGSGGWQRLQSVLVQGRRTAGSSRLRDRGYSADHRRDWHIPERTKPERSTPVSAVLIQR